MSVRRKITSDEDSDGPSKSAPDKKATTMLDVVTINRTEYQSLVDLVESQRQEQQRLLALVKELGHQVQELGNKEFSYKRLLGSLQKQLAEVKGPNANNGTMDAMDMEPADTPPVQQPVVIKPMPGKINVVSAAPASHVVVPKKPAKTILSDGPPSTPAVAAPSTTAVPSTSSAAASSFKTTMADDLPSTSAAAAAKAASTVDKKIATQPDGKTKKKTKRARARVVAVYSGNRSIPLKSASASAPAPPTPPAPTPPAPTDQRPGKSSIPVISVVGVNVKGFADDVRALLGHDKYTLSLVGRNGVNLRILSMDEHAKVLSMIREKGIASFTYSPKGQTARSVVLEGLSSSYDEEDVRAGLRGLPLSLDIRRVVRLGGNKWLIHLARGPDVDGLFEVRRFLSCRVLFRKDVKVGVSQCFNCQRFGHVSTNCGMPFRCVKCGGEHGPGKCAIPKGVSQPRSIKVQDPTTGVVTVRPEFALRCVNCGVDGHAASAKNCPKRQALLAQRALMKSGASSTPAATAASAAPVGRYAQRGVSYAAVATVRTAPVVAPAPVRPALAAVPNGAGSAAASAAGLFASFDAKCRDAFGKDFLTCAAVLRQRSADIRTMVEVGDICGAMMSVVDSLCDV